MKSVIAARTIKFIVFFTVMFLSKSAFGQNVCLTADEAQKVIAGLEKPRISAENKALRLELLGMKEARQKLEQKLIDNLAENQKLIAAAKNSGEKNLLRLCEIVKNNGWLTREAVGEDGVEAALLLIKANQSFDLQRQIFPIVAAAAKKGLIGNQEVAWLVDSIRVSAGLPQIFGTQTKVKGEVFYLYPLQNEGKVDEYRKLYNLPPLESFIKFLQLRYQTVVLKSPPQAISVRKKENPPAVSDAAAVAADPLAGLENSDVITVESSLVSLNVRVGSDNVNETTNLILQKNDFAVYEDGKRQEISFFSAADEPFDVILVLDLSGSTADKQNLIRKSTRQFIESARPSDRIAIVTFTDEARIISDLTLNRQDLLKSIKKIDDRGGSAVWGSLRFVYDKIIKPQSNNRRTAVLLMTDGVDSSLLYGAFLPASYPTFSDVLDTVRRNETTIFPVYLDTSEQADSFDRKAYRTARITLEMLAEESGGQVYNAKKVSDLNGVYEKIINDLGKVYSLGYEPSEETVPGSFHELTVKLPNHPNLKVRAKKGYYAK